MKAGLASSSLLARRTLAVATVIALVGALLGTIGIRQGIVTGLEIPLILSAVVYGVGALGLQRFAPRVPFARLAAVSTLYFTAYLVAGTLVALGGGANHIDAFIYLVWFFPLLVFNKLVNLPVAARIFARCIIASPLLIAVCGAAWIRADFAPQLQFLVAAMCLSYLCFASLLDSVTRYREEFVAEQGRAEALKLQSRMLESISDCFLSLDSELRLTYLNDAACAEFGVERGAALDAELATVASGFMTEPIRTTLEAAIQSGEASVLEASDDSGERWYELRAFPRTDGLSVYFRNVTEAVVARRRLDEAARTLREQAELLDKAQDAILVADMNGTLIYWNKGAEALYGWSGGDAVGRTFDEIFGAEPDAGEARLAALHDSGEWTGERSQRGRDGRPLIVESRCTLVRADDGTPRSILAINTDITNRKAAEAKVQRLAFYDVLTELPNRLLLRERLEKALAAAERGRSTGALLFIDLDDFKLLNDTLGHDVGDRFLAHVARRLTECVRVNDTVARLGGDEFVVMLEGLNADTRMAAAEAKAVGDKILSVFGAPFYVGDFEHNSTASIGITLFPAPLDTVDDLLKRADLAMYRAKAQGRNTLCFFDPGMQAFVESRSALQADLRRALLNREFELRYQPQVDVTGAVIGAEALLRWQHAEHGWVSPAEFIPLAESAGLIVELGRFVLETACAQIARWSLQPATAGLTIAVNVSLRQFLDANFVNVVLDTLGATGIDPRRLKLEITESSAMENADDTIAKMTALRARDVGFSLDDFGTGYSSLSHLKRLPLDQLKIDRGFVTGVLTDPKDASIVRTLITLGRNLDLLVIAEGVETAGQRDFLEREGCGVYQGFLFSPALSATDFERFVAAPRMLV